MDPFRRSILLAPVVLALAGAPAFAEKIPLAELSRYLNGLRTVEAGFTQFNADGSRSTGRLFIHRPNRMRFEYNPPDEALVLASAGQVAIFDSKSNQPPEQYPLRRTPLNLILARNIDLSRARMVVAHEETGEGTAVVAQDPEHPEYGTIRLIFTANPLALRQWVVTDEVGSQTTVVLDGLKTGQTYPPSMFSISVEQRRRN
jgi:outer membrane lipoprotein-sorting protein